MNDINHLAREMVRLGAKCAFGIPGEGASLLLIDELEKLGCAFYLAPHEGAGALMAGGFGRVADTPGISISIKGPGFSNMLAGIASNWLDRNPALSLSESYAAGSPSYRMHKRMDHAAMVRPVSKAYAGNVTPSLLSSLWELCLAEDPGPVHLDISQRMESADLETGIPAIGAASNTVPDWKRWVLNARRPVIIAGALAGRRSWGSRLASLSIPIFTTVAGKGAIDETLPNAAGVFTYSGGPDAPESAILPKADLIVGLGLRTTEIIDVRPFDAPLILMDELTDKGKGLNAALEIQADSGFYAEVFHALGDKDWGASEVANAKIRLNDRLAIDQWLPAGALQLCQQSLPDSTIYFLDTGSFCTMGEHVLAARRPAHIMGSAQGRSMGVAIPNAIGAALAVRDTPVVAVAGDGGMRLYPESLTIAVNESLPLLVLLMTDRFLSSIRQVAVEKKLSDKSLRVGSQSWTAAVRGWGCRSERIESPGALQSALNAWMPSTGPLFLELAFDPEKYMAMTRGLR